MRLFCRLAKLVETRQPRRSPAAAARRRSELAIVSVCPKSPATNCGMKRNTRNASRRMTQDARYRLLVLTALDFRHRDPFARWSRATKRENTAHLGSW